jgi:hypothetical protein
MIAPCAYHARRGFDGDEYRAARLERVGDGVSPAIRPREKITPEPHSEIEFSRVDGAGFRP